MADREDAQNLYLLVADLYLAAHLPEGRSRLLDVVDSAWVDVATREANPEDAEVCRLAMLTAAQDLDPVTARMWRARALARFAAIGWVEGVASLIMGDALAELSRENNDYATGRTLDVIRPSAVALRIMEELERFTTGPDSGFRLGPASPSQPVLRRFFFEKRGFLLLLDGDFDAARESYDRALEAAGESVRGQVKVRLGRLLVDYLMRSGLEGGGAIAAETEALGQKALETSSADVARTAFINASVMRDGRAELRPYEIL